MKIILGKKSGFCYGVQNAVEKAESEVINSKETIYCLGELVHNKIVTSNLESKGLVFIEDLEQAKGKTIIRAHGIEKNIYEDAKKRNIELIDLTCPNVLKIHDMAYEYSKKGYYIILVGKKNHPETIGSISFCGENSKIISDSDEVEQLIIDIEKANFKKVLVISQTTYSLKKFDNIVNEISNKISKDIQLEVMNTICLATELRQTETNEISKQADIMIVVGGKNSSNTTKLYEICLSNCKQVIHIEHEKELKLDEILKYDKVGIVAGASTPKDIINKVVSTLKNKEENL